MPTPPLNEVAKREAVRAVEEFGSISAAAKALGVARSTLQHRLKLANVDGMEALTSAGYDLDRPERTPKEAWDSHVDAFEAKVSGIISKQWRTIQRPKGPVVLAHFTDEHLDDDASALRLIEEDIKASHDMNAVTCHGGDALNNWPLAGKLAKQWAEQKCTLPDGLLRLQHFIDLLKPEVWTDGNHEEFNPYLDHLIGSYLPKTVIRDYWSVNFQVETPGGRPIRGVMSHKFQKGSSWFHPHHGFIREMMEGQEADIYLEGHIHVSGWMYRTFPERGISALGVASAGYKVVDRWASRISQGGKIPKLKGRAHWIVADTQAEGDEQVSVAFDNPRQAEAYLNGLQNLRAV